MPLDGSDISRLYRRHAEPMVRYLARRTYDPEVAVDLVAESFAAAFAGRATFRGDGEEDAAAWLYGIARNQLGAWYRRGDVERRALGRLGVDVRPLTDVEQERIEDLAELAGLRARVAELLGALPEDAREALRLRVVEEHGYPEIAAALEVSEQVVRARVSRALRSLAAELDADPADVGEVRRGG